MIEFSQKALLLLGSGFSVEIGLPLVNHITERLKKHFSMDHFQEIYNNWLKDGFDGFTQESLNKLYEIIDVKEYNYEQIIGKLEKLTRTSKNDVIQDFYHLTSLVNEPVSLIFLDHHNHISNFKQKILLYKGLRNIAQKIKPLWIISLNHDLLVEMITANFDIPLNDGFGNKILEINPFDEQGRNFSINLNFCMIDKLKSNEMDFFEDGVYGINFIKLHGSIGMYTCFDQKYIAKISPNNSTLNGWILTLFQLNEIIHPPEVPKSVNEISYYDSNGTLHFLRRTLLSGEYKFDKNSYQEAPKEFLKFFESKITEFKDIIIIGYGFKDLHINNVLIKFLTKNNQKQVIIVDPYFTSIPDLFIKFKNRIRIIKKTATEFLKTFENT